MNQSNQSKASESESKSAAPAGVKRVWSGYQEAIFAEIARPITDDEAGHLVVIARAGCIAGDAMIAVNRAGKGFKLELSEVVRRFNGGVASNKTWDPKIETFVRAPFSDGSVRLARVDGAMFSGSQETGSVQVSGRTIRATWNHCFMTPDGWVPLKGLRKGDILLLEETHREHMKRPIAKRNYSYRGVPFHPFAVNNGPGRGKKVPTHRLQIEAKLNKLDLESFVWRLQSPEVDDLIFLPVTIEVHHKDTNPQNNGLDNLIVLDATDHRRLHYGDGHLDVKLVKRRITSIKDSGMVETYDLNVPGPDAFMANGIAVHNSGKTSTILEGMRHVPRGCTVFLAAFSKSIAEELQARAPQGVEVRTLHSYGLRAVTKKYGRVRIDSERVPNLARAVMGNADESLDLRKALCKVVGLAKGSLSHTALEIDTLMDAFGISDDDIGDRQRFIADALTVLGWCKTPFTLAQAKNARDWNGKWLTFQSEEGAIDFDDMIWLPVVHDFGVWQFDRVFIDETQDLNLAQIRLALKACKKAGRICAVGDDKQAIFAFRGADHEAIGNVVRELGAKVLTLPRTYRCAKAIVALAREYVPDFECAEDASEGQILRITDKQMFAEARPGDFILSRTNAPLIGHCLRLIRQGKRANIQGRDVGASLAAFVKKSKCKTVEALRVYVDSWRVRELARLTKKIPPADTQTVEDRAETLLALSEHSSSISELVDQIKTLFSEDEKVGDKPGLSKIILSTTHKAKGLERDRVFVIESTFRRKGPNGAPPSQEENNLWYVAVTRARETLFLVGS